MPIIPRQQSSASPSGTPTSTTSEAVSTIASSTSDPPFFETSPPPSSPTPRDPNNDLAKTVLEWMFLVLALLLVALTIARRLLRLRRQGVPASAFFSYRASAARRTPSVDRRNFPRTTGLPPFRPSFGNTTIFDYPQLSNLPAALYHPNAAGRPARRTRGADVDAGGRRGAGGPSDYDGELGDKDALPAYDKYGGPPTYLELDMQDRLAGMMGNGNVQQGRSSPTGPAAGQTRREEETARAQAHERPPGAADNDEGPFSDPAPRTGAPAPPTS